MDTGHPDGNSGASFGYESAGRPYVALDEVEGISEVLVGGCDEAELRTSGRIATEKIVNIKSTRHGLIVQERGDVNAPSCMTLNGTLIHNKTIRVDKVRRMRCLGDNNEIEDLRRQLGAERKRYSELLQLVKSQEQSQQNFQPYSCDQ